LGSSRSPAKNLRRGLWQDFALNLELAVFPPQPRKVLALGPVHAILLTSLVTVGLLDLVADRLH
jgi:hypothetical protein